jgi:hypothetical protein
MTRDVLHTTAKGIARRLWGVDDRKAQKKVYNLLKRLDYPHRPPIIRIGSQLSLSERHLVQWLDQRANGDVFSCFHREAANDD